MGGRTRNSDVTFFINPSWTIGLESTKRYLLSGTGRHGFIHARLIGAP